MVSKNIKFSANSTGNLLHLSKILVVDDKMENILAMKKVLKKTNAQIFTASSGNEALALILKHKFCLVLLDVQMPVMDGFEVAELMKSQENTKYIPIIFVTAISKDEEYIFRGYDSGAIDYLFKPIEPKVLTGKSMAFVELHEQKESLRAEIKRHQNTQDQLNERNKMLGHKNRGLETFTYVASHNLQEPLRMIVSYIYQTDQVPEIHVAVEERNNEYVFFVEDNSIESKYKEQVFETFKRLHTRDQYTGNGMRLAICRKVIERHNGRIWAESKKQKGSKFYFTISRNNSNQAES